MNLPNSLGLLYSEALVLEHQVAVQLRPIDTEHPRHPGDRVVLVTRQYLKRGSIRGVNNWNTAFVKRADDLPSQLSLDTVVRGFKQPSKVVLFLEGNPRSGGYSTHIRPKHYVDQTFVPQFLDYRKM
jgi:hypothetical protein